VVTHPQVDAVVLGLGVTGGNVAAELSVAGRSVVGIDKGQYWDWSTDFSPANVHDEWSQAIERKFDHPLNISTFSVRNDRNEFANPVRRYTKIIQYQTLGNGVGGAALHYSASLGRYGPFAYKGVSSFISKYGTSAFPSNHDMEDFPVTYDEMVPYYVQWEKAIGMSGTHQDPFTPGAKFETPPHPTTPLGELFRSTAESMGYHTYPTVNGIPSQSYVNQYGIPHNACQYCGYCSCGGAFVCMVGAKSSSHVTTFPAAVKSGNFEYRLNSYVFRIDLDSTGKSATGVRYYDSSGTVHVQPAKTIFNGIWGLNIVRLLLLSGIGKPYNPVTQTGTVGRGPSLQEANVTNVRGTVNIGANAYSAGNAAGGGFVMQDFADDNFDHKGLNFFGGANIAMGNYPGNAPALFRTISPSKSNFGSTWKATQKDVKLPKAQTVTISPSGPTMVTKDQTADLDPHYNDMYGDPCTRLTTDWNANVWRTADYLAPLAGNILTKMGATNVAVTKVPELSAHVDRWVAHIRGGLRQGDNPATAVFNKWMQSYDVQNVFAAGEICYPWGDNTTAGTHPAAAMAYLAADGMKKYLASPGPLV